MFVTSLRGTVCALAVVMVAGTCWAADAINANKPTASKPTSNKPTANIVELFAGIEAGQIEVHVFPKDAAGGNITVKNKTDKPLTIKLPPAFAGVPVLAQLGGGLGDDLGGG